MTAPADIVNDPKFTAAIALIGRTGAQQWQLRYSDDEAPTIWMAAALYADGRWDAAAGRDPVAAVLRLCEVLVDGGTCAHCKRPSSGSHWYQQIKTFRRGCEGT